MKIKIVSFVFTFILLVSCKTPKDVTYFQGVDSLTKEQIASMNQTYTSYICPDDLLTITVTAWDPSVVTPFNPPTYAYSSQGEENAIVSSQLYSYLVDKDGYITFPVLGKIQVKGLSKQELSEKLQKDIEPFVKDVMVKVQIINYKITVMGEVSRPGAFSVKNDRVSILDAMGQAGDLTINANRKNILIIRDNDGVKEFARIDITSPEMFASPYFYLRQNDIVYVEPNKAKKRNSNYSQAQQYSVSVYSAIVSTASVITALVISLTKK